MKLSKSSTYAINWLHSIGKSPSEIAEELKIKGDDVVKYLEKYSPSTHDQLATKASPVSKKSSADLMIRHTRDKKINNVAIMTKEASELNDDLKKKINSNSRERDCIFKPKK